jgi:hypothetical protein
MSGTIFAYPLHGLAPFRRLKIHANESNAIFRYTGQGNPHRFQLEFQKLGLGRHGP